MITPELAGLVPLAAELEGHMLQRRRELVETYRTWEDKYAVPLRDIEARRTQSSLQLDSCLRELGYAG